jgi:hypothetical protein
VFDEVLQDLGGILSASSTEADVPLGGHAMQGDTGKILIIAMFIESERAMRVRCHIAGYYTPIRPDPP